MGSMLFRDPQACSSTLATLGMLQLQAFGSLKSIDPLDSVSNYYLVIFITWKGVEEGRGGKFEFLLLVLHA